MKDFARLNVYIAGERGVTVTRERAEFEASRLVSELGGQLAIWLGVSVVTLCEVVELIVLLVHSRLTSKRRTSYDPSSSLSMTDSALCSASSTLQHTA
jgi:hypothetical protein